MGGMLGESRPKRHAAPSLVRHAVKPPRSSDPGIDPPEQIERCLHGLRAPRRPGAGPAPARQAAIHRRPAAIRSRPTTINKMCGSAMHGGDHGVRRAGRRLRRHHRCRRPGEHVQRALPHDLEASRRRTDRPRQALRSHVASTDSKTSMRRASSMGNFAEDTCAQEYQFTREKQDEFRDRIAHARAGGASCSGKLRRNEIVPITVSTRKGDVDRSTSDEQPSQWATSPRSRR